MFFNPLGICALFELTTIASLETRLASKLPLNNLYSLKDGSTIFQVNCTAPPRTQRIFAL